ncbi:MAG TPA: carbohydrate ABC transporter permease [Ruminococcaceae bacterium]|nr:carbohydrate ABC transporter permease [Oscillospiraceae bacterium]
MKDKLSFKKGFRARTAFLIFNYLLMVAIFLIVMLPILKVVSDSFEGQFTYGFKLWPKQFTLIAYKSVLTRPELFKPFLISLYTTIVGATICMTFTTLAAYVLIQENMPGKKLLTLFILVTMVFNAGLIPTFMVIRDLNLLDSLWAVILPLAVNSYDIILMRNFFEAIPQSLSESAELDGCTPFQIFYKIILPLSKPALATIGLFALVAYWNEFFSFVMYINNPDLNNFQMVLRRFVLAGDAMHTGTDDYIFPDTLRNCTIVVSMIPVLIVYPFLQKYFVSGINLGAVKE